MVRQVRYAKEDAGGFEPPDSPDDFDELDDFLCEALDAPGRNRRVRRRPSRRRPRRGGQDDDRSPPSPDREWLIQLPETE